MTNHTDDGLTPLPTSENRLRINAATYKPDKVLDPIADRIDAHDPCSDVHPLLFDRAQLQRDFRQAYRDAVKAGVVDADRG